MILLQLKLLIYEGYLTKICISFILFAFLYVFEIYLIIPFVLLLLAREILGQSFPNERIYKNYKLMSSDLSKIQKNTNVLIIALINGVNASFLVITLCFPFDYGYLGTLLVEDLLNQIFVSNALLFFILLLSNWIASYCYSIGMPHLLTGFPFLLAFCLILFLSSAIVIFSLKEKLLYGLIGFLVSFSLWIGVPKVTNKILRV